MKFKEQALRISTIIGAFLILAPVTFMLIVAIPPLVKEGLIHIDYLIPLEVFPVVFLGAGVLTLIACKVNIHKKKVCSFVIALILMFFGGQYIAVITGLADGSAPAKGLAFLIVVISMIIFDVLTIIIGIYGVSVYRQLKS
jgi:hypothetical protein